MPHSQKRCHVDQFLVLNVRSSAVQWRRLAKTKKAYEAQCRWRNFAVPSIGHPTV